jgi:Flp pilus assembly secretin CpaC
VLSGTASSPLAANRIRDLASRFAAQNQTIVDLMGVRGEQQVMLQVKVMEARRSVLREYGINTNYKDRLTGGAGIGLTAPQPFATGSLIFDDNGKFGPLTVSLDALERDGLVNTLAEPNLTAISGETAGFLAGGEFPVPVGTTDDGNTVTLEFKQFGVSLNFTPTVLTEENISLHLATEVSALADDLGLSLAGVDIPGLTVRRAETTVEMSSGGSIMIAGLIQSGTADNYNSIPGIGKLPILGELFKSKSFQRDESELIIMVTPLLVKPFAEPRAQMATAALAAVPSPVPAAMKPALNTDEGAVDRAVRDMPEARPVRTFNGEQRTQGVDTPVTPRGRAAPLPIRTEPLPMKQGQLSPQAVPAVEVVALDTPTHALAAPATVPVAKPQAPNALSQHFVRNLKATYGAKADAPVSGQQNFGYMVD